MNGRTLTLAAGLVLAADVPVHRLAFIGTTNSGKTYAATKTAELMWDAGTQFVALDVMGIWWGLRLAADGIAQGLPIAIFGGKHGDVAIDEHDGALVAETIYEQGISAIVDISEFETDAEKNRFAYRFAERLYNLHKAGPRACHLFLEEAHEYLPQNTQGGDTLMLNAWNRLWKQGGNFGLGGSIISQRPQDVNKKALELSACVFAFNTTGTNAVEAMRKWMGSAETSGLQELQPGNCIVWSPSWLQLHGTFKIEPKRTFHARFDPMAAVDPRVQKEGLNRVLAPVDLQLVRERFAKGVDEGDDPKALLAEIERLKKARPAVEGHSDAKLLSAYRQGYERGRGESNDLLGQIYEMLENRSQGEIPAYDPDWDPFHDEDLVPLSNTHVPAPSSARSTAPAQPKVKPEPQPIDTGAGLPQQILDTIRTFEMIGNPRPALNHVGAFLGKSSSSGYFRTNLNAMKADELVDVAGGTIALTEKGRGRAKAWSRVPSLQEIHDLWIQKSGGLAGEILAIVLRNHPRPVELTEIGAMLQKSSTSGYFRTNVNTLKKMGLVTAAGGKLSATNLLFPEGLK